MIETMPALKLNLRTAMNLAARPREYPMPMLFLWVSSFQVALSWTTTYPLFSISNKPKSNWTSQDVEVIANAFRVSDGISEQVDGTLLRRLREANPDSKSVKYCNPRGIEMPL